MDSSQTAEGQANFKARVERVCFTQLTRIRNTAKNMVEVEALIARAREEFFGTKGLAELRTSMTRAGKEIEFMEIENAIERSMEVDGKRLLRYLLGEVPVTLRGSSMYRRAVEEMEAMP